MNNHLKLEDYIFIDYLFTSNDKKDIIYEDKLDFLSEINNDMLTISCKYCDIKININKSKLEFKFEDNDESTIEILGKDFIQFVELKGNIENTKDLASAKELVSNKDFKQNINFIKKLLNHYISEIQKGIKDVSNINDKVKLLWKLSLDECQVWPPQSQKYDEEIKLYLDCKITVGCIAELTKDDLKDKLSLAKAIIRAYTSNTSSIGFTDSKHPTSLTINDFVFDGIKFKELVKTFKNTFGNANISSLIEILKFIPEVVFGMPIDSSKSNNDSKEFVNQLKNVIKKSLPKLKELKEKTK